MGKPAAGDGLQQWDDLLVQPLGLAGSWCLGKPSPCHPCEICVGDLFAVLRNFALIKDMIFHFAGRRAQCGA